MSRALALQTQIAECEKQMELASALEHLNSMRDFKLLTKHLFQDEAVRLVSELHKYSPTEFEHTEIVRHMDAISYFQEQLKRISRDGVRAQGEVQTARRYLGESRIED